MENVHSLQERGGDGSYLLAASEESWGEDWVWTIGAGASWWAGDHPFLLGEPAGDLVGEDVWFDFGLDDDR